MDSEEFERLVALCKSNDVDVKVDAVSKLQHAFESGIELKDAENVISALKACIRTSNNHLVAATLSSLPAFIPLVTTGTPTPTPASTVDVTTLRLVCASFLPAGGLMDRLGDTRERVREKARESVVIIGGLALRCNPPSNMHASVRQKDAGKGAETPLMIWERIMRESGLASKVWRVREQSILTLVHIRRAYPLFPMKSYLPQLVEALEDTDGTVRETARQSVVELFTGSAVTDAARADLKKEMTKKGVRKTIVDSVTQKLMAGNAGAANGSSAGSPAGSENGDAPKKDYIPPSLKLQGKRSTSASIATTVSRSLSQSTIASNVNENNSRPASRMGEVPMTPTAEASEVPAVYIASVKDMENEFASMLPHFEGRETEHNWAARDRSISRVRGMLKGDAHIRYRDTFLANLKSILDSSFKTLASLRTIVATNTCSLYAEVAEALGTALDSFCEPVLAKLMGMAGSTKKIVVSQTQATVDNIISNTSAQPKMISQLLWTLMQDKIAVARQYGITHLKYYLEVHGQRAKHAIEMSSAIETIEKGIKKSLVDTNPAVREGARLTCWVFESIWKDRGAVLIGSLDPTARKLLEKVCPEPGKTITAPSTPKTKKSSVAAAIAASRAKAKAIATAPPTLRHQATSNSQAVNHASNSSPTSTRSASPAMSLKGTTVRRPASRPLSPASPTRRTPSYNPPPTSMSVPAMPLHSRSRSSDVSPLTMSQSGGTPSHRRVVSYQSTPPTSPSKSAGAIHGSAHRVPLPLSPPRSPARSTFDMTRSSPLPPSPPIRTPKARMPSPTRIPSPTRKSYIRDSLDAVIGHGNQPEMPRLPRGMIGLDESLLLAQAIPLPDDSESDDDSRLLTFSAPYERFRSTPMTANSSVSMGSPPPSVPQPIVEDALRARAEQAESAAERLLELVEPDDDSNVSPIPPSLLPSNGSTPVPPRTPMATKAWASNVVPATPTTNKRQTTVKQMAMLQNSPAYKGSSSLVDVLKERKHETSWWLKRMAFINKGSPLKQLNPVSTKEELRHIVVALEEGTADVSVLKKLAWLCLENPVHEEPSEFKTGFALPMSPSPSSMTFDETASLVKTVWDEERLFDRMFNALFKFLVSNKSENEMEYGLFVLWEMLEHQGPLVEGKEADVFSNILQIRYCSYVNVLEATTTIRDAVVARVEPVYGVTTMLASLRAFLAEPPPAHCSAPEVKSATYAFGLIALGKFILRLPAEILEDELPRLKVTLITALMDMSSLVVRESAATCIVGAQLVLRDEQQLFTLLDGLPDEKKNLLTYLFDKHGARGVREVNGAQKLEKEMRRLDGRTSTPPRPKP